MPNHYSHTIYKQYVDMLRDQEKQKIEASSKVQDEIEEAASS